MDLKVVLNKKYGGYGLSKRAMDRLEELGCPGIKEFWA